MLIEEYIIIIFLVIIINIVLTPLIMYVLLKIAYKKYIEQKAKKIVKFITPFMSIKNE